VAAEPVEYVGQAGSAEQVVDVAFEGSQWPLCLTALKSHHDSSARPILIEGHDEIRRSTVVVTNFGTQD
jgi:hypothetical protein